MISSTLAAELLLAASAYGLPELAIEKRHKNGQEAPIHQPRGLVKRQSTVETNVYDIITYSTGGAYYANSKSSTPDDPSEGIAMLIHLAQSPSALLRKTWSSLSTPAPPTSTSTQPPHLPAPAPALTGVEVANSTRRTAIPSKPSNLHQPSIPPSAMARQRPVRLARTRSV